MEFYRYISIPEGKEITDSGWKSAGIFDALELGSRKTPSSYFPFYNKICITIVIEIKFYHRSFKPYILVEKILVT